MSSPGFAAEPKAMEGAGVVRRFGAGPSEPVCAGPDRRTCGRGVVLPRSLRSPRSPPAPLRQGGGAAAREDPVVPRGGDRPPARGGVRGTNGGAPMAPPSRDRLVGGSCPLDAVPLEDNGRFIAVPFPVGGTRAAMYFSRDTVGEFSLEVCLKFSMISRRLSGDSLASRIFALAWSKRHLAMKLATALASPGGAVPRCAATAAAEGGAAGGAGPRLGAPAPGAAGGLGRGPRLAEPPMGARLVSRFLGDVSEFAPARGGGGRREAGAGSSGTGTSSRGLGSGAPASLKCCTTRAKSTSSCSSNHLPSL